MIPNVIDYTELLRPYENKWVVISEDHKKVLGSGDSLDDIPEEIMQKGYVMKVLPFNVSCCPSNWAI